MSGAAWTPSEARGPALEDPVGERPILELPDGWTKTESWKRACSETDRGAAINDAERVVFLEGSTSPYRVVWALTGRTLRAECPCQSGVHRGWCAHLATLWRQWSLGEIVVTHLDTGRDYDHPPGFVDVRNGEPAAVEWDELTPAEMDAYLHVQIGEFGGREFARATDRAWGTVSTLLDRARSKVGGGA